MGGLSAPLRALLAALGPALLSAALLCPCAGAAEAPTHALLFSLAGGIEQGIPVPPPEGEFEDACGVALDPEGDLYVSDYYHRAIDVYGPGPGSQPPPYITQIPDPGPNGPCNLAVDAEGDVFANQWRAGVLEFKPSEFPPSQETDYGPAVSIDPAHTNRATGIAVDAGGDLYVDEGSYIARYEAPVEASSEPAAEIGAGTLGSGYGLALSAYPATAGRLYVPDAASGTVKVFGALGESLGEIDGAGLPGGGFASLVDSAVAVDPSDGHLFVAENTEPGEERPAAAVDEFNSAGDYRGRLPGPILDAAPSALAVSGTGHLYVTSGNGEGAAVEVFGPTEAAHTLNVTQSGAGEGLIASEPAGIHCPSACAAEYNAGAESEVVLTAIPDPHSAFGSWSGCLRSSGPRCTVKMNADQAPVVAFEALPQQTLTLAKSGAGEGAVGSEPEGIACALACDGEEAQFNQGAEVTLTATAPLGSRFAGWSGGGCSGAGTCTVTMSAARSVGASFEAVPVHTLSLSGEGAGTVTSEPAGIECGETCSAQFNQGAEVTLKATPAAGSRFAGWAGGGCSGTGTCEVTIAADTAVSATFVAVRHTLAVARSGAGEGAVSSQPAGISCGQSCTAEFNQGTALTLTATAAAGSRFAGWSGGGCSGAGACRLTLDSDAQVSADFVLLYPILSVSRVGAGQGTVSSEPPGVLECGLLCAAVLDRGATVTLLAHPLAGSVFAGWSGCEGASGALCTVTIGADRALSADFEPSPPRHRHRHRHHRHRRHRHRGRRR